MVVVDNSVRFSLICPFFIHFMYRYKIMKVVLLVAVLCLTGVWTAKPKKFFHPLSDELVNHINSMKTTWKVTFQASRLFSCSARCNSSAFRQGAISTENSP